MLFNIKIKEQVKDNNIILNNIFYKIKENTEPEEPHEQYGFNSLLNDYRNRIDKINPETWKKIRWYINYYDFLVKDPIINRAFYKYWEIINIFQIFKDYNSDTDNDIVFHCAEAPGGFIQGTNIFLQLDNELSKNTEHQEKKNEPDEDGFIQVKSKKKPKDKRKYKIYTISLNKDLPQYKHYNLPSYNKRVINKNICISYGKDNTGDINNLENINYIKNFMHNKAYLITADGGFDEGNDFNNKEQLHYYLILNEIYSAIAVQKENGHFILKVFDIFTNTSIHLLYLLSLLYEDVFIYKPKTSRPTNSEKYVICKNFTCEQNILNKVINVIFELSNTLKSMKKNKYNSFELFDEIPIEFIHKIKNMNNHYIDKQCNFLEKAIKLCDNTSFMEDYENQLNNSSEERKNTFKEWEDKYNLNAFIPC